MRQWRKTAMGGHMLYIGEIPVAYQCKGELWSPLVCGAEPMFKPQTHEDSASARAYAERQLDLWLLKAGVREL